MTTDPTLTRSATTDSSSLVVPARRPSMWRILTIALVVGLDAIGLVWVWSALSLGLWLVGSVVLLLLGLLSWAVFVSKAVALRWLLPTIAFLLAFALAPILYTGYIAMTNYSGVHLLTRQQAVEALERQTFVPEGVDSYAWAAYESPDGVLGVFLVPRDGGAGPGAVFATADGDAEGAVAGEGRFGAPDEAGFPVEIDGFVRLDPVQRVTRIGEITDAGFGPEEGSYQILSASQAAAVEPVYEVDPGTGAVTDRRDGVVYAPTGDGYFTSADGERLTPAFQTFVGLDNVVRLFTNESIRTPFLRILAWTVVFCAAVVAVQFALGLLYAVVLNGRAIPPAVGRAIRSVLLLPYVIPAYLMILTWTALLNQQTGLIPRVLHSLIGLDTSWVATATGARIAMLVVGVWLGFPYFLLITTGALQAIPADLLEAASIDGAGAWTRFRRIVLPLLMRMIAPLLVLAAAFNFNNFLIAYLLFGGGPPQSDAQVPAGSTDLLISFTYKLSFDFGGSQYALAAVVTVMIFLSLTPIVLSQLRYYNSWLKED